MRLADKHNTTVDDLISKHRITVVDSDKYSDVVNAFGYTYTSYGHSTIYLSPILNRDKDVRDFVLDHEISHILYDHTRGSMSGIAIAEIKNVLKARLEEEKKAGKLDSSLELFDIDKLTDKMYQNFSNIAQDFEVNSKLYPNYKDAEVLFRRVAQCIESEEETAGIHPGYVNQLLNKPDKEGIVSYPSEEDHVVYLKIIAKDFPFPSKDELLNNLLQHSGLSLEDIKEIKETDDFEEAMNKLDKKMAEENENRNEMRNIMRGLTGTSCVTSELRELKVWNDLQKYIISKLKKDDKNYNNDLLYNYNRQKYSNRIDQVLIPKMRLMNNETLGDGVILADVSGSMPLETIRKITATLFKLKIPVRNLRLLTWDTHLTGEYLIRNKIPPEIKHGGGTKLSWGIEYAKRYLRGDSKLFIISDLEDSISEWERSLEDIGHSFLKTHIISTSDKKTTDDYLKESKFKNVFVIKDSA